MAWTIQDGGSRQEAHGEEFGLVGTSVSTRKNISGGSTVRLL